MTTLQRLDYMTEHQGSNGCQATCPISEKYYSSVSIFHFIHKLSEYVSEKFASSLYAWYRLAEYISEQLTF